MRAGPVRRCTRRLVEPIGLRYRLGGMSTTASLRPHRPGRRPPGRRLRRRRDLPRSEQLAAPTAPVTSSSSPPASPAIEHATGPTARHPPDVDRRRLRRARRPAHRDPRVQPVRRRDGRVPRPGEDVRRAVTERRDLAGCFRSRPRGCPSRRSRRSWPTRSGRAGSGPPATQYVPCCIADAPSTMFTLHAGGLDKIVTVGALGFDQPTRSPDDGGPEGLPGARPAARRSRISAARPQAGYSPAAYRGILFDAIDVSPPHRRLPGRGPRSGRPGSAVQPTRARCRPRPGR